MHKRTPLLAGAVAAVLGGAAASPAFAATNGLYSAAFSPPCTPSVLACDGNDPVALETAVGPHGTWVNGGEFFQQGILGFGVSAGQSVFLRFDLSGGATYGTPSGSGTPTLYQTTAGGFAAGTLVAGGGGANYAIFQLTASGGGLAQNAHIYPIEYYAGHATAGVTVPATQGNYTIHYAEYASSSDAVAQTNPLYQSDASLIVFAQTLYADGAAGTPLKIDVTSNDTLFTGGATVSPIGELAIANASGRQNVFAGTLPASGSGNTHNPLVATTTSKTTLTVTGDFSAAPTTGSGALAPSAVLLSNTSGCHSNVGYATSVTATQAVFNVGNHAYGAVTSSGALATPEYVCYQVNGTTPIQFGVTYTAKYQPKAATGYTLAGSYPLTLGTLDTNGVTATVLNIPSGTSGGDAPYIRIYNTSSIAGPIRGTLYAQDGSVLYNGVLIPSLAPGQVQVLDAQQLQSLAGGSWSGRARLDVFGQIPAMDVQALVRTANGTLVNVSAKAPGGSP